MLGGSPSKATLTEPLRGIRVDAVSGGGARAGARPGQAQVLETGQGAMQKGVGIWVAAEAGAILGVQLKNKHQFGGMAKPGRHKSLRERI